MKIMCYKSSHFGKQTLKHLINHREGVDSSENHSLGLTIGMNFCSKKKCFPLSL